MGRTSLLGWKTPPRFGARIATSISAAYGCDRLSCGSADRQRGGWVSTRSRLRQRYCHLQPGDNAGSAGIPPAFPLSADDPMMIVGTPESLQVRQRAMQPDASPSLGDRPIEGCRCSPHAKKVQDAVQGDVCGLVSSCGHLLAPRNGHVP